MKTAIIFGITGQDGSYLAELLLEKEYKVIGVSRRTSTDNSQRLTEAKKDRNFHIVEGDITDFLSVADIVREHQPDEVYSLAAQSHVGTSFRQPVYTFKVNSEGPFNILEAVRTYCPSARLYQASTSEMFGNNIDDDGFQRETTHLCPTSPYAIAKCAAHHKVKLYREAYDIFAVAGILYNHESERRGHEFLSRKVTKWVAEFSDWLDKHDIDQKEIFISEEDTVISHNNHTFPKLKLGNLNAKRDWGYAPDYVEGMWRMLQTDEPTDYVLATGVTRSVRDFVVSAFKHIGISNWPKYVITDKALRRPSEVNLLKGDATKAKEELGWVPTTTFDEMVCRMIESDRQCLNHT